MAAKSPELYREALKYMNIHSGKIGRYAVQRTIEHLKRCNVVLDQDVKEMRINIPKPEQRGAERFFYENVPQLKFKNPHVEFSGSQNQSEHAELLITFMDECQERILLAEKEPSQIMQEVVKLAAATSSSGDGNS